MKKFILTTCPTYYQNDRDSSRKWAPPHTHSHTHIQIRWIQFLHMKIILSDLATLLIRCSVFWRLLCITSKWGVGLDNLQGPFQLSSPMSLWRRWDRHLLNGELWRRAAGQGSLNPPPMPSLLHLCENRPLQRHVITVGNGGAKETVCGVGAEAGHAWGFLSFIMWSDN